MISIFAIAARKVIKNLRCLLSTNFRAILFLLHSLCKWPSETSESAPSSQFDCLCAQVVVYLPPPQEH